MKKIIPFLMLMALVITIVSCSKSNPNENHLMHEEGKTGYRETICDITLVSSDDEMHYDISSVMKYNDMYYVITQTHSFEDGSLINTMLYQITEYGDITNTVQINELTDANKFVMVNDNIVCIGDRETTIISAQDGRYINSYQSEMYPIVATSYSDDYVVCYQDHIVLMDIEGNVKARIDSDFGYFSVYCDCLYEYDNRLYLVACPGFEYVYYEIDFDNQYCNRINSSTDLGIELSECNGGYIFDETGEYKLDPSSGDVMLLAEWKNTNVRPGGNPVAGYRYYWVFDDDHFVKSYIREDGTACIQIYEYDNTIDYSDAVIITVGGIALSNEYSLQDAIYRFNSSQTEYRVITQEFENESWENEYIVERNTRLISEFNSGNAPDVFYGDLFDYDYFGRNGLVIDMLPYLQESDSFNATDIEPSLWNVMSRDNHCYHLFNAYSLYGYWGKESMMSDNVNMTYEELLALDNPEGLVASTIYSWWIGEYILNESFDSFIDDNGSLTLTEEQIENIVNVALAYGLPSSAGFDLLGVDSLESLRNNEYLITNTTFPSLYWYNEAVSVVNDNLSYVGFPSVNGACHPVFTSGCVAVSSSTSYPEACVDFISYMFDEQAQEQVIIAGGNSVRMSVNNAFFDYAINPSNMTDSSFSNMQLPEDGIAQDVIDAYREAITLVDTQYVADPTIKMMIMEEIDTYDLQGKPIDQIAESLYSRLSLYVDEVY